MARSTRCLMVFVNSARESGLKWQAVHKTNRTIDVKPSIVQMTVQKRLAALHLEGYIPAAGSSPGVWKTWDDLTASSDAFRDIQGEFLKIVNEEFRQTKQFLDDTRTVAMPTWIQEYIRAAAHCKSHSGATVIPNTLDEVAEGADSDSEKKFFVLVPGNSPAGKSHATRHFVLPEVLGEGAKKSFLAIDGGIYREVSPSWTFIVDHIARGLFNTAHETVAGISDLYERIYKTRIEGQFKTSLRTALIDRGISVIQPDILVGDGQKAFAALHGGMHDGMRAFRVADLDISATMTIFQAKGYEVHVKSVFSPLSVSSAQGLERERIEGKQFDSAKWKFSIAAMVLLEMSRQELDSVSFHPMHYTARKHMPYSLFISPEVLATISLSGLEEGNVRFECGGCPCHSHLQPLVTTSCNDYLVDLERR